MDNLNTLEKIENYFKKVNCYGEYNYCFSCQKEPSILPIIFGVAGAVASIIKDNKVVGYLFNQNDQGICLIPIVVDTMTKNKVAIEKYVFIKQEDIEKIIIKNEDIKFKKIKIVLKDKTKFVMRTSKKIKNIDYHENNLNKFIELYK